MIRAKIKEIAKNIEKFEQLMFRTYKYKNIVIDTSYNRGSLAIDELQITLNNRESRLLYDKVIKNCGKVIKKRDGELLQTINFEE